MRNNRNTSEWKALRTQAIMAVLGWHGGTIHQLQKELGLTDEQLHEFMYGNSPNEGFEDAAYTEGFNEKKIKKFYNWVSNITLMPCLSHEKINPQYLIGMADWIIMNAAFYHECEKCKETRFVFRKFCNH